MNMTISYRTCNIACCGLTFVATILLIAVLISDRWEHITFDLEQLTRFVENSKTNSQNSSIQKANSDVEYYRFKRVGNVGVFVWFGKIKDKSSGVVEGAALFEMFGGLWKSCRNIPDDYWQSFKDDCRFKTAVKCIYYTQPMKPAPHTTCCEFCAAEYYAREGISAGDAMKTTISCAIVSTLLLAVTWCLSIISAIFRYVSVTMMAGVTLLLSALFLFFSLMVNQYKVSILLDEREQSVEPLPPELIKFRSVVVGWAMIAGYVTLGIEVVASVMWMQLSSYLSRNPQHIKPFTDEWLQDNIHSCLPFIKLRPLTSRQQNSRSEVRQNGFQHSMNGVRVVPEVAQAPIAMQHLNGHANDVSVDEL